MSGDEDREEELLDDLERPRLERGMMVVVSPVYVVPVVKLSSVLVRVVLGLEDRR